MTIISKNLAEGNKHKHSADKNKILPTDLFRGPEFTGSEDDLMLLLKHSKESEKKAVTIKNEAKQ